MVFIENHCHLSDERVFERAFDLITAAEKKGVRKFVLAGVEPPEWETQKKLRSLAIARNVSAGLYLNFGVHPWWIEKLSDAEIASALVVLEKELPSINGLGETGLDHGKKRDASRFEMQEKTFRAQIRLALRFKKPIILHIVSAHELAIKILKEENASAVPLVVHSYSGNEIQAQEYLKLGAFLSYSGSLIKAGLQSKTILALRATPLDRLFFETDSPDQYWGEGPNSPVNVIDVYQAAANILQLPLGTLCQKVAENFEKVYYSSPTLCLT